MKTRLEELATVLSILTGTIGVTLQSLEQPSLLRDWLTPTQIFLLAFDGIFEARLEALTANEASLLGKTRLTILEAASGS